MDIQDAVAVVTGAGVGSGLAIARRLLAGGARVTLTDRAETTGTAELLRAHSDRAALVTADLTHDDEVAHVIGTAVGMFGGLSLLVNNAGGGAEGSARFPDAPPEAWTHTLWLNLRTPLLATQLALPHLRAAGGVVVNIGSSAGLGADPYWWPEYGAAKAGLIRFTTATRLPHVRLNCIVPGWLLTDRAREELAAMTPEARAAAPEPIPLKALTDAVVTLITDDARSGAVVRLL